MVESFEVVSIVLGYLVYKDVHSAAIGTILPHGVEKFNPYDSYAVAMIKDDMIV